MTKLALGRPARRAAAFLALIALPLLAACGDDTADEEAAAPPPAETASEEAAAVEDAAQAAQPSALDSSAYAPAPDLAADETRTTHALSLFGLPKYDADFAHFDYVNADAPKGGTLRAAYTGSFDSFNPYIVTGTPPPPIGLIYDTLMTSSYDEPGSEYGLLAETITYPGDYSWVEFKLRDEAHFHDGEPVTADDVIFTFDALTENHPFYAGYYANVEKVEKTGERSVRFSFNEKGNRELPLIMGQIPVLPAHYWDGSPDHDITKTTLVPPIASGPYRIVSFDPGKKLILERVKDYWARDLAVNVGHYNFDRLEYEFYLDETVMIEAFKGDRYDFRVESSAKRWATEYEFPAVKNGEVIKEVFDDENPEPMQAFAFNTRRAKFSDPRVREAFNDAFDFEWMRKNIFYGQYERTDSYFEGSELEATGTPGPLELELLEPLRGKVPEEVFTKDYENPTNEDAAARRANLRRATQLLKHAGWEIENGKLTHTSSGEVMDVEFLLVSPTFERIVLPYKQALERLGVTVSVRTVDTSQYRRRLDAFDFDIVVQSFPQSLSPGNEQRDFWGSEHADREGSRNVIGIKDEAVDRLIDAIIFAPDRTHLVAACRALDRVLLWNHFVVPHWYSPLRTARWDRLGHPEPTPPFHAVGGYPSTWWYEPGKAPARPGATAGGEAE